MHVLEKDHGVCSTLCHVLYNVFHRDWGRETVSNRDRVPSRRSGHVLAKKKRNCITLADPSQWYPDLLGLSPRCYSLTLGPGTGWCSNRTRCRGTVASSTASGRTWCPTGCSLKNKIKTKHKIRGKHSHVKGLWRTTFSLFRAPERGGLVSVPGVVDIGEGRNTA